MKERLRQSLLARLDRGKIHNKNSSGAAEWLLVYVPEAVASALRPYPGHSWAQTVEWCSSHGATNPRVKDNQVIMTWPQHFWAAESNRSE